MTIDRLPCLDIISDDDDNGDEDNDDGYRLSNAYSLPGPTSDVV